VAGECQECRNRPPDGHHDYREALIVSVMESQLLDYFTSVVHFWALERETKIEA